MISTNRPSISNVDFKTDSSQADVFKEPQEKNFGWFLPRLPDKCDDLFTVTNDQQQIIPGWTPFNGQVQNTTDVPPPCNVGYCQTIDARPRELSTVHTILQRSLAMADQLSQEDVIVVLDQAIYCKAKQLIWSVPEDYSRIVLRMGAFHICCNFLGILGKRFGEAGLGDLLIENGLVAAGSIASVLNGHHYNRAVRANKVVFEALLRMKWSNFGFWLAENPIAQFDQHTLCALLTTFQDDLSSEEFQTLLHSRDFSQALEAYEKYTATYRGPMAAFWESYLAMFELFLNFIRSTREGNWDLHKACLQEMLPWMFTYDHTNYARYLTVYLRDMLQLHETHPTADEYMQQGEFAVQRCEGHAFSQIPVGQTIEQTVNPDSKTPGGIIGFSLNKSALQR